MLGVRCSCTSCCSVDIQIFAFPSFALSLTVIALENDLEIYDVINFVNKNLITRFVWDLKKENGMPLKLSQLIEYYIRNIFMKKSCRKCAPNASPRPLLNR